MSPTSSSLLVLLVSSLGFLFYIILAQRRKSSRIEDCFVGGRNIGAPLFTQTTWGSSFAFGNSIFYAVWLGYTMGLSALWVQALWAWGMVCYARLLPRLISYTQEYTLHGFLGSQYGRWARFTASIISIFGLTIGLGFEVTFAGQYFAQVTRIAHFEWLVVLIFAIFAATFSSIGGFKANMITDRITNYITLSVLVLLVALMAIENWTQLRPSFALPAIADSAFDFSSSSLIFLIGIAFFPLYNIVDMSNWQNVSANSLASDHSSASKEQRVKMRTAMFKAAALFLFAPVLTGTLLGYMIKVLERGTQDQTAFMATIMFDLMPVGMSIAAVGLALATFAFMASSLSLINSWLLACSQTLSWDLIDHDKFKAANFKITSFAPVIHEQVTRRARIALLLVGIVGASCVYYISKYIWGDIFQLQFVIFGGGLAMLPSLLYAIFVGNPSGSRVVSGAALASIVLGYAAAITLFAYSLINSEPDAVSPLPLVSLIIATIVFIVLTVPLWLRRLVLTVPLWLRRLAGVVDKT